MTVQARYFDGKTSKPRAVEIAVEGGRLSIAGDGVALDYLLDVIDVSPPLANISRYLRFPDGGQCEVNDSNALDAILGPWSQRSRLRAAIDLFEQRTLYAVAALAILVLVVFGLIRYGVPVASQLVAMRVNPSLERRLGEESLQALDATVFEPTRLPRERRDTIIRRFSALAAYTNQPRLQLEFRAGERIGPNAFSLPGGIIVVLDELVALAADDDAIASVIAHELGHVHERHTMRSVLQNAGTAVLIATIFGDAFSASAYAAALPTMVLEASYSRDFEREADDYAIALMDHAGIDRERYVELLQRMDARSRGSGEQYLDFLQSHPGTSERIERTRLRGAPISR